MRKVVNDNPERSRVHFSCKPHLLFMVTLNEEEQAARKKVSKGYLDGLQAD